ncbi:MAG: glycosyltransferase [Flavobacteriia bacterium]|nr:glycosyltransferase [Flavobacteriia bacterium]
MLKILCKNRSIFKYFRSVNSKKRILVAPLDWGLGHASRCVPIAKALEKEGYEVVFASSGRPLELLIQEFPKNDFIKLESYNISYPKNGQMALSMLSQLFKIWKGIRQEHKQLQQIIDDYNIDGVISDNRYGLYSKKVPCVFVTHQLQIQSPIFSESLKKINFKYIQKFDECWVPDSNTHQLSGQLSKANNSPFKCQYIGALSRFESLEKTEELEVLAIVSGPEPQRSMFEELLRKQLIASKLKAVLVLGKTEENKEEEIGNLKVISHLNAKSLNQQMVNANVVISRSGYSTLMDIAKLNKKAIFVPTPGQTEQLYLAKYFYDKNIAYAMHQKDFNLKNALIRSSEFNGFKAKSDNTDWKNIFEVFNKISNLA